MNDFTGLYDIRDGTKEDRNFILATFLRALYYGDSWYSDIPKGIYMNFYNKIIQNLLENPAVIVKIACLKEDSNVILGYSILGDNYDTIHFLYVKSAWRNKGIGMKLIPKYATSVTHLTALGKKLLPKLDSAVFNPFLI